MPLVSLSIRPGINSVKTPALNEGGWSSGDGIRFFEGMLQKDSGWVSVYTDATIGTVRALKAWRALTSPFTGDQDLAIAGQNKLIVRDAFTFIFDITPTPSPWDTDNVIVATLDNWGVFLMACASNGPIFVWDPATANTPAVNIATGPQKNGIMFVAIQQQIMVVGGTIDAATSNYDPMLLRWCDVGDYTVWIAGVDNQAGGFRLAIGSSVVAGLVVQGQNLIWTDNAVYSMSYIGFPLVWGFQPLGVNCGAVSAHSVGILGGAVYWMGPNQFFTMGPDGTPKILPCDVWDDAFPNRSTDINKPPVCETDSYYGEVAWSVPQADGSTRRVRFNPASGAWTSTSLHYHTAWIDQNTFGPPIGGHEGGDIDQHDIGYNSGTNPQATSAMTGDIMISEGDEVTFVREMMPDFKFGFGADGTGSGTVNVSVYFYDYPRSTPRISGPFAVTDATTVIFPRGRGRIIRILIESGGELDTFWRLGNCRYRAQADGKR